MIKKFTILGCGSSLGTPWITGNWGKCDKKNLKNIRSRCSAHIQYKNISICIDTSPDIKEQFKKNKITSVDSVVYTHEHADQTSGIFELRPFFWKNRKKVPIYGSKRTVKELLDKYTYCFKSRQGYKPILKHNIIKKKFSIKKGANNIDFTTFEVDHGMIKTTAYLFNKVAYLSDCNKVPSKYYKYLKNLNYLIIDCLRYSKHPSHFNYDEAIKIAKKFKPKKTILTNLHADLDYSSLIKKLPKNIVPAYDGLKFNF